LEKGKIVPVHAIQTYRGSGGIFAPIHFFIFRISINR